MNTPHWSRLSNLREILVALVGLFLLTPGPPAMAGDGRLEINQECALAGCFPGDSANFPVTISEAGSYVLTGNITVAVNFIHGIEITADGVTLDLNGFTLTGPDSVSAGAGISLEANEITVRNGLVRDFAAGVVRLTNEIHGNSSRVIGVTTKSNAVTGIMLGSNSLVADCIAIENGASGILVKDNSIVRGSTVSGNATVSDQPALQADNNGLITGNTVLNNGDEGILVKGGSAVLGNVVSGNGENGIKVSGAGYASVVRNNTSSGNTQYGISADGETLISNNSMNDNRTGLGGVDIEPCATCTIIDNHP